MKKILFFLLGFIIIVFVGLFIFIKSYFNNERISNLVRPVISKKLHRNVKFQNVKFTIFPNLGLDIKGVEISNNRLSFVEKNRTSINEIVDKYNLDTGCTIIRVNGKIIKSGEVEKNSNIKIVNKTLKNRSMLYFNNISLSLRVLPLFKKQFVIKKILIDSLDIYVENNRDNILSINDLITHAQDTIKNNKKETVSDLQGENQNLPVNFFMLESFEIRKSNIEFDDEYNKKNFRLGDINYLLTSTANKNMSLMKFFGKFNINNISVKGNGLPVSKSNIKFVADHDFNVDLKKKNISISKLKVGFQKFFVNIKGSISNFDADSISTNISLSSEELNLKDIFNDIPKELSPELSKINTSGKLKFGVNVKGIYAKNQMPKINGFWKLNNIFIQYKNLPEAIHNLNSYAEFTDKNFLIKKFHAEIGKNPINLFLKVDNFDNPKIDLESDCNIDLAILKKVIPMKDIESLSGKISSKIKIKGKADPENLSTLNVNGFLKLENINAKLKMLSKFIDLKGQIDFSNNKIFTPDGIYTNIGTSDLKTYLSINDFMSLVFPKIYKKRTSLNLKLKSKNIDIDEIFPQLVKKSKPTSNTSVNSKSVSSKQSDNAIIIPELPKLDINIENNFNKVTIATIPIDKINSKLTFTNKILKFDTRANLYSGSINENLFCDLNNKQSIHIKNSFKTKKLEANDFISKFNDFIGDDERIFKTLKGLDNTIYGKMDLNSSFETSGIRPSQFKKALIGDLFINIFDGKIKNSQLFGAVSKSWPNVLKQFVPNLKDVNFNKNNMIFHIKNENVIVEKMEVNTTPAFLSLTGNIGFDNNLHLNSIIRFDKKRSDKILKYSNKGKKIAGNVINRINNNMVKNLANNAVSDFLVPTDKNGCVVAKFLVLGTLDEPKYKFLGFGGNIRTSNGGSNNSVANNLKADLNKKAQQAKAEMRAKALKLKIESQKRAKKLVEQNKKKAQNALNIQKKKINKAVPDVQKITNTERKKLDNAIKKKLPF